MTCRQLTYNGRNRFRKAFPPDAGKILDGWKSNACEPRVLSMSLKKRNLKRPHLRKSLQDIEDSFRLTAIIYEQESKDGVDVLQDFPS